MMSDRPTLTTWEMADGEPIWGEFSFMTDRLWIDEGDWDGPVEFVRTEWVAVRRTKSWRSEDRPVCLSCHGEGETSSGGECGRCLGDGFFDQPIEEVVSDERWLVESTRDPAASAPLSELVAVNIAGDIEAVADELASERHYECDDCWYSCPESGEGCCNDNYPRGSGCTCHAKRSHTLAARLRRIAAGIREAQ